MDRPWLEHLNDAQREAVEHGDGPLLIVAGAGTGKTNTLACRVTQLIADGVAPERILLLTFTRRAAREMVSRAGRFVGEKSAAKAWGGTFHATANRLLRIYGESIGLPPEFTVMDQSDAADVMNMIRSELGFASRERRFAKKATLIKIYSRTVCAQSKLSETLAQQFPWCAEDADDIAEIFEAYTRRKRQQNLLDYDDLLLFWRLLLEAPAVGDAIRNRFDHVLVDEYQDTNAVQADILMGLRRENKNICVVGDDAQAIYSFRAATVQNILDFPQQFPGTRVITLEQNYRSTSPILDASNAVMAQASKRYTKNLWSKRESQQRPILVHCADEDDQCASICRAVLGHLEEGIPLMRQAVLFRTGWHSDRLEVELARRKVPFRKFGGLKFVETGHIKDMVALLRILENPHDEISWFRVLMMLDGIGPKTARRMIDSLSGRDAHQQENGAAPASPLSRFVESPPTAPPAARQQMDALRHALGDCCGLSVDPDSADRGGKPAEPLALGTQIERIRTFYQPLFERKYDNAAIRLRDLEQLEQIAAGYDTRESFLTDLTLDPPDTSSDFAQPPHLDEDYLILSTIHSAKGCEWDTVHILHAADGMIPSDMAVRDEDGVDEERRLFYVAMTRAKDFLYIYFPLRFFFRRSGVSDRHGMAQLTRFITPDVRRLLEERAPEPAHSEEHSSAYGAGEAKAQLDEQLKNLWAS